MSSLYLQILNLNIVLFQLALVLRSVSAAALLSERKNMKCLCIFFELKDYEFYWSENE
jgi:hypothetical protein